MIRCGNGNRHLLLDRETLALVAARIPALFWSVKRWAAKGFQNRPDRRMRSRWEDENGGTFLGLQRSGEAAAATMPHGMHQMSMQFNNGPAGCSAGKAHREPVL